MSEQIETCEADAECLSVAEVMRRTEALRVRALYREITSAWEIFKAKTDNSLMENSLYVFSKAYQLGRKSR